MLPAQYQLPAAMVLLLGGIVACFFGYRLFKFVLGIFGFILGALAASSIWGSSDTVYMVLAALLGGLVGGLLLLAAYFVGVALVGAGLGWRERCWRPGSSVTSSSLAPRLAAHGPSSWGASRSLVIKAR